MRNKTLKLWAKACATLGLVLLAGNQASAAPSVTTLAGGQPSQYYGYRDGNSLTSALFHTPAGLAVDSSGNFLFVADRDNNAIRFLDLSQGLTYTLAVTYTNLINHPVAVAVDGSGLVTVLNRGNGTNGSIYTFDCNEYSYNFGAVTTNAVGLTNATGMSLDKAGNIYVAIQSNRLIRIDAFTTNRTTIATITNAGTSLQGIVAKYNGLIAACDSGRNGIYLINPTNGVVTTNAGFHGVGDFIYANNIAPSSQAAFNQPMSIAEAGDGTLVVADYGNHRVKVVLTSGVVTNLYGVTSTYWGGSFPGWYDGTVKVPDSLAPNAQGRLPFGVAMAPDGTIYTSEDYYHIIRKVTGAGLPLPPPAIPGVPANLVATPGYGQVVLTWSAVSGATNYYIKKSQNNNDLFVGSIAQTASLTYTDTNVIKGTTYYYVVSASNSSGEGSNSVVVGAKVLVPVPPTPRIGWFDYELNNLSYPVTVLHPIGNGGADVFHNDLSIAIDPVQTGLKTFYIAGPYPLTTIPTNNYGSTPPDYVDHSTTRRSAMPLSLVPDLVINAVSIDGDGQSSLMAQSRFVFQVANPVINGYNGAQFTISDETTNTVFWYTLDGSDPTNRAPSIGPIYTTNVEPVQLSINVESNVLFKVVGYRNGYLHSGIVEHNFTAGEFVANTISFGLASGEASSDFVASPGQSFYAPVTLSTLSGTLMYSLQFNLTVTNAGSNPGPAITTNAFGFKSMLMKPDLDNPGYYVPIPPYAFAGYGSNAAPTSNSISYHGDWYVDLENITTTDNLLSVGWVERMSKTNLYDTKAQDLITYSMAHDIMYPNSSAPHTVIVGGYSFVVPATATNGQTYQIRIGAPSATSDGIGAAGSSVFIAAPTNGATAGGDPINALKYVTVGQRKYIVGDVYPFHWFNAGDFGSGGLVVNGSANVEQVFQSAVYGLNSPPYNDKFTNSVGGYTSVSDFFDAMDSCGATYVDNGNGYLEFGSYIASSSPVLQQLFDGNDSNINQIAFGDGRLDICDVYVTFRRSVGSTSLNWFRRYWQNGKRVAEIVPHTALVASKAVAVAPSTGTTTTSSAASAVAPKVNFTAGDIQGSAGQVVTVPITATVFGDYPLRVLMLNLTVEPLDGSPALTTPVQFTQTAALGTPYTTASVGTGNFSAVWLNSSIAGLTGTATIGTLSVTLPAGAGANAAYAVHFDHVSASPNGLASFPKQALTGLITLSSRTNSTYGDGIPDSWRLRWFGSVNNYLSLSNACPSGDGVNNWLKFVAGVDPLQAGNFPSVGCKTPVPANASMAIHWPTVSGKQYVIERSSNLFAGPWSAISTNTGTGTDMEFDDTVSGATHFYRVRIVQ